MRTRFSTTVQIRLDEVGDAEFLQAMREAGINTVAVGFESPMAEDLKAVDKRLKPDEMAAVARAHQRAGFRLLRMFVFGYPMKSGVEFRMAARERVRRSHTFIRKARIDSLQVLLPVPLPMTEMTRRLEAEGRLYPREVLGWEYYDGIFPLFEPDEPLTPEDMRASIRKIMGSFYGIDHIGQVALNVLSHTGLVLHLHNLRAGWRRWWRSPIGVGG